MRISSLAAISAVGGVLLASHGVVAQKHKPLDLRRDPLITKMMRSPPTVPLELCSTLFHGNVPKPNLVHKLTIPAKLDPHHILADRATHKINSDLTDEDADPKYKDKPYKFNSGKQLKTLMDLNLQLSPGDAVLIKIIVADQGANIFLRGDIYTVTVNSSDPTMFCRLGDFDDGKSAIFEAFYVPPVSPATELYGGFNIGILINDNKENGYSLPVFLDPEVKNNG